MKRIFKYVLSLTCACICGYLFYGTIGLITMGILYAIIISLDIKGYSNRADMNKHIEPITISSDIDNGEEVVE